MIRHGGDRGLSEGFRGGVEAAQAYLGLAHRPTAVVSCVDDAAISFISTIQSRGLTVPGDVSVTGFDGAAAGEFSIPPLTTVAQPTEELGARAAAIMLQILDGAAAPPLKTVVPSLHCPRASTGRASCNDEISQ